MLPQMVLIIPRIIPILFSNRGKQVLVMHVLPKKAFATRVLVSCYLNLSSKES